MLELKDVSQIHKNLDLANKINEGDKINDGFISIPFRLELPVVLHIMH